MISEDYDSVAGFLSYIRENFNEVYERLDEELDERRIDIDNFANQEQTFEYLTDPIATAELIENNDSPLDTLESELEKGKKTNNNVIRLGGKDLYQVISPEEVYWEFQSEDTLETEGVENLLEETSAPVRQAEI